MQFDMQLADLAMHLLDHRLVARPCVVLRLLKHPTNVRQQPPLPLADQIPMHAKLAGQLAQRLVILQRGQTTRALNEASYHFRMRFSPMHVDS